MKKILVTGAAGFIGASLSKKLVENGAEVIGLDNLNDYYEPQLKIDRMSAQAEHENFTHVNINLADRDAIEKLFTDHKFDVVMNLAAQAGVRYSLINPHSYIDTNVVGFVNLLEGCRHSGVKHFVYASSSSVYGANTNMPFSVHDNVDHPVSLYAASKKSNELMAHTYSHLYGLPTTGLRFFTVYGPWGRPDMAPMLFSDAIMAGRPINVFNNGNMERDFTYIDDIVEGVIRVMGKAPVVTDTNSVMYRVQNIGNGKPIKLMDFIEVLEKYLGKVAEKNMLPMQPGDVTQTWADTTALEQLTEFIPQITIEEGVREFVTWIKEYDGFKHL